MGASVWLNGLVLYLLAIKEGPSRWSLRTLKRRARTEELLSKVVLPLDLSSLAHLERSKTSCNTTAPIIRGLASLQVPLLDAPIVDWSSLDPIYDPQQGGKLRADSPRAQRKRRQVEAFAHVVNNLLGSRNIDHDDTKQQETNAASTPPVIVDAGSGAGNLAIPLIGLLLKTDPTLDFSVCAIDVNDYALSRLTVRGCKLPWTVQSRLSSLCADLASPNMAVLLPEAAAVVCSLHACGAATDMAIRMAVRRRIPFCVSPCCTAKVVTMRQPVGSYGPATSTQRSAAPADMIYPRSQWLRSNLLEQHQQQAQQLSRPENNSSSSSSPEQLYELLARTADVGLGPQTPVEQWEHQRLAKYAVELDRLQGVAERHNYTVCLLRLRDHDDYGKSELLVGVPADDDSVASRTIERLSVSVQDL
jgi:hypothetical protein